MTEALRPDELARLAGVSTDTLRYYERKGLLQAPPRTTAGYRRYSPASVDRVQLIRRALGVGFSVKELARVLAERDKGGVPCRQVHALLTAKLGDVERELTSLVTFRQEIQSILVDWTERLAATPAGRQARLLDTLPPRSRRGAGNAPRPLRIRR